MSFSTSSQRVRACRALLRCVELGHLFDQHGPTAEAAVLLEDKGGTMSTGEFLMLQAAFDVWNGRGGMPLGRALGALDNGNLRALSSLLLAMTGDSCDIAEWIETWGAS